MSKMPLVSYLLAVPSQQGFRRDNRCQFLKRFPSDEPGFGRHAATLVVGEAKPPAAELGAKDSIFLAQVRDRMSLLLIHPSSNGDQ